MILDSCFSGRAIGNTLAGSTDTLAGELEISGTYTLTSAPPNSVALVREGEAHTAFTGRLISLLRTGDDAAGDLLTLGDIYRYLHTRLLADGLPIPQQRGTATADRLGLVRNCRPAPLQPASLTEEILMLLGSGSTRGRLAGVAELGDWLAGCDPRRTLAARLALKQVAERDNPQVAGAARRLLGTVAALPVERFVRDGDSAGALAAEPEIPDDIDFNDLDPDIREELRSLVPKKAELVGGHLVMAGRLIDEEPEKAYAHAQAAQRIAPRLAATREALGLAAYLTDRYGEALAELRAARQISGSNHQWAVMADCERGLGRPEKALEMHQAPEAKGLDKDTQVELRIVAAGACRDLGQVDAAVALLQGPDLNPRQTEPWTAGLRYAYAEALLQAGREDLAQEWFAKAIEVDPEGNTGARERLAELDQFLDSRP